MKTRYAIIVISISLTSCMFQEELDPVDYDFRGSWDSQKYAIQIFANGYGMVDIKNWGRCEGNVRINGNKMTFISENEIDAVGYKRFTINQRPTTDSLGVTYMILNGYRLEKH